jgi:hypothetical protein
MQLRDLTPCFKDPVIGPHLEPTEQTKPHEPLFKTHFNIITSSNFGDNKYSFIFTFIDRSSERLSHFLEYYG